MIDLIAELIRNECELRISVQEGSVSQVCVEVTRGKMFHRSFTIPADKFSLPVVYRYLEYAFKDLNEMYTNIMLEDN